MLLSRHIARLLTLAALLSVAAGCATSYNPVPSEVVGFQTRSQVQTFGNVTVEVAVPSIEEARALFGVKLDKKHIQPVWVRIKNGRDDFPILFLPINMDPDYYSAAEASYKTRFSSSKKLSLRKDLYFQEAAFHGSTVAPGEENSGFIFVNLDEGTKAVVVSVYGPRVSKNFVFLIPVPGFRADYLEKDPEETFKDTVFVDIDDEEEFVKALEAMPRAVKTSKDGDEEGDPLNLVLLGDFQDIVAAFTLSGWDETHALYTGTALKTGWSFLWGKTYRYAPISSLYVFGRPQDVSFQKSRKTIHERNHMRFWLTNIRHHGRPVWLGQISRDIGIKYTFKTGGISTHKIDPDVDKDRGYVFSDLLRNQALTAVGFVRGVDEAPFDEPRYNGGGDPYFTDGLRAVMLLSKVPVPYDEIEFVDWGVFPPAFDKVKDRWFDGVRPEPPE
jgi:hypothetical protein